MPTGSVAFIGWIEPCTFPHFFLAPASGAPWPPVRSPLHALERGSIGLLVATSIVEPVIGLINSAQWYPFGFPFVETHYLLAWLLVGLLAVHVAIKLPTIVRHWRRTCGD